MNKNDYLMIFKKWGKNTLNRSGESGHPYFVPEVSREAFGCSLLSIMLSVGLSS